MGLFAELKRRNVFRVGVAYIVLGWVVIQVTDVAVPALRLPEWVPSLVFFFGLIGFPFALLFAWAFELTPEGIKPEREVDRSHSMTRRTGRKIDSLIIGLLAIAVVFLAVDRFIGQSPEQTAGDSDQQSIAILPFDNLSNDPEQAYFSDGLTEELISTFARIEALRVAGSVSSRIAGQEQLDAGEIGDALGVRYVLLGSVRRSGSMLRVSAQLVDTDNGFHVWSQSYDRELIDIFAVQDDIASSILNELRIRLGTPQLAQVSSTRNTTAYDHYLQGVKLADSWEPDAIAEAQRQFAAATAADPEFAEAWAYQALVQMRASWSDTARETAAELNRRALAINPDLPEAHAVAALILAEDYRYEEALESNARAIAGKPGYGEAYFWRSGILRSLGHVRDADLSLERAFELDRLNPRIVAARETRECQFYLAPVSAERMAELEEELHPIQLLFCNMLSGNLAAGFRLTADPRVADVAGIWPAVNLKECEPLERRLPATPRILQLVACRDDEQAQEEFAALPVEQQRTGIILEWIAIAQLRQGMWEQALASLGSAHGGRVPIAGQASINGLSSNASLALGRVLANRELGIDDAGSADILRRVRQLVENFKGDGVHRGYRLLEAKLLLLEGDRERAIPLIVGASDNLGVGWVDLYDPILLKYVGESRIRELATAINEHVDTERAELGWPPSTL